MEKNNFKVSNLYGRARRIELVEKIAYFVVGIVAVILVVFLVTKQTANHESNVNFSYLREYLEDRGYICDRLQLSGGQCIMTNENSTYMFVRRDSGFEYNINTSSYILNIKHYLNGEDEISFKTYSDAFVGYRNRNYICSYKGTIIGGLDKCEDEDTGEILDLESYKGIITKAMQDVNNILDSSGYDKEELLENYIWKRVK